MKKLLFLDYDGVVNTIYFSDENPKGHYYFPEKGKVNNYQSICFLNEIYKKVPFGIVVTSTWRMGLTVAELNKLLHNSGLNEDIKVIDKTLLNKEIPKEYLKKYKQDIYRQRGFEIDVWLKMNKQLSKEYNFKDFIILDDDADMWKHKKHLIQTTQNGFLQIEYGEVMGTWFYNRKEDK